MTHPSQNRVARYMGDGQIEVVCEPSPVCPPGGLLVETEACGLCSGELMAWYMDRKVPHVLGHEVAGRVMESQDDRFPVGSRVFPHHHAPCLRCEPCSLGRFVHCEQWKRTKLRPGGMADRFAVAAENLNDTLRVDDLRPEDAALIEPLACVAKSLRAAAAEQGNAVIGLGVMGLMHLLMLPPDSHGFDLSEARVENARQLGLEASLPHERERFETVFVCPGSQAAFDFALRLVRPGGTILMFAPLAPDEALQVPQSVYFNDLRILNSYSAGPDDTPEAAQWIRDGKVRAEQVCSHFISIEELPEHYGLMKRGEILKPMVRFANHAK